MNAVLRVRWVCETVPRDTLETVNAGWRSASNHAWGQVQTSTDGHCRRWIKPPMTEDTANVEQPREPSASGTFDGGRRGVLPREAQRPAEPGRRAARPSVGRLPADRLRSRSGSGSADRALGPGGRARHVPPAAPARPRRRVRPGGRRARSPRCRDRGTAVHGGDAAQRE